MVSNLKCKIRKLKKMSSRCLAASDLEFSWRCIRELNILSERFSFMLRILVLVDGLAAMPSSRSGYFPLSFHLGSHKGPCTALRP